MKAYNTFAKTDSCERISEYSEWPLYHTAKYSMHSMFKKIFKPNVYKNPLPVVFSSVTSSQTEISWYISS